MSLKFLPLPLYIIMCFLISSFILITAVKRYNKDRKGLILVYLTVLLLPLLAAMGRIVDTFYKYYDKYTNYISIVILCVILLLFVELIYLALTHKGNKKSKLLIKVGFIIISLSVLPMLIFLLLDYLGIG